MASILKQFFTVSGHSVILKGFLHQSLFQVLLLSSVYSSQREYFITFYTNTHSLSSFLQSFNYLITYPQGNCFHLHDTTFQLFQFFGTNIIFFSTLMETFRFLKKRVLLSFTNPIRAYDIFRLQSSFLRRVARFLFFSSSFSFPSDSTRGCRAKVWYQTRNTPARLGFAPEDSQPCEPWCRCSCLFPPG